MRVDTTTSFTDAFIQEEFERDPAFQRAYEAELQAEGHDKASREELVRTLVSLRKAQRISQRDLARKLGISQPRVAQIEKLAGSLSADLMLRYVEAIGATIRIEPRATQLVRPRTYRR
jgi:predicted XRE-type DNA-binding protein